MNENVVVKTKNSKGLIALVIILFIMVVGLIGYTIYDKMDNKKIENKTVQNDNSKKVEDDKEENYDISDIAGVYTFSEKDSRGENINYTLYLNNNGLFEYNVSYIGNYSVIGNYTIKENSLNLNYLFEDKSGGSIYLITKGSRTLEINNEEEIIDNNKNIDDSITSDVVKFDFKKDDSASNKSIIDNLKNTNNSFVVDEKLLP